MNYSYITPPSQMPGIQALRNREEFKPPKKKPQGKRKYIIEGQIFYLISKKDLEEEITASAQHAVELKKKTILATNRALLEQEAKDYRERAEKEVYRIWDERAAMFRSGDAEENIMNLLQFMLSVGCRVLVEHFGWKPIPKDGRFDRRHHLMKFMDLVAQEIQDICDDEDKDIIEYAKQTYDLYGCKFEFTEPDEQGTYKFEERKKS